MSDDRETVLVTGASGFIATHIIQQLQQEGYKVRGTVRSTKNEQKVKPLSKLCPDAKYPLELVEADLNSDEGWNKAVQGCQFVMHVASPFPSQNPEDDDELIKPAVDGTLRVLKACSQNGVKKVVLTSSVTAIADGLNKGNFSESDWSDVKTAAMTYNKSKILAEKAAWDYVKDLSGSEKFDLAVINPAFVVGPALCGGWATSMEMPLRLLERKMPALPRLFMQVVDVRDVATAHINAMKDDATSGNRHILATEGFWFKDVAIILQKEFKDLGYNVPTHEAPYFLVKLISVFDKSVQMILPIWGVSYDIDNSRMKNVLKIDPRPIKKSFVEMAHSLIEKGFIKKTDKYRTMNS